MQPRVVTVGPLTTAASATQISLSQTVPAAQGIAMNGVAGVFVANNIATSQSLGAAATVAFASAYAVNAAYGYGATLPTVTLFGAQWFPQIYITSAGNDSGITFTIQGHDDFGAIRSETITGSNTSVAASRYRYSNLYSIKSSGATAAAITVGTFLPIKLDAQRQVLFTDGGNDSGITFTISGMDANGNSISEVVTGASGATVASKLSYLVITKIISSGATATTLSVGTNGLATSQWLRLDDWALGPISCMVDVTGTVNYTIQSTNDDPNSYGNPVTPSAVTWDSTLIGQSAKTGEVAFNLTAQPAFLNILLNSGSGTVTLTAIQSGSVTL